MGYRDKVRMLGDKDPDGIAEFLASNGVRGQRGEAQECVLSQFLTNPDDGPVEVWAVNGKRQAFAVPQWSVVEQLREGEVVTGEFLPASLQEFAQRFDGGGYPELER